jgi:mannosyltransferase
MRYHFKINHIVGALLILFGVFGSSSAIMRLLRNDSVGLMQSDLKAQLLLGITLFKVCIVLFGILVIILGRKYYWKPNNISLKSQDDPNNKIYLTVLTLIIFSATLLRLYRLDSGLWYDEIVTYVKYIKLPFRDIISIYDSENQHVLFTILSHACYVLFGENNWAIRLPAMIFGVGSLWALYFLGCQFTSRRESLLAVALLAFSYQHIWFSQNARGYTGLLFWTIMSSLFFVRGLKESRPYLWLMYSISAALGVYTHITMLFVVFGQFIIYLLQLVQRRHEYWPDRWHGFFYGFCFAGFFTVSLYSFVLPQIFSTIGEKSNVVTWKSPIWTFLEIIRGLKISFAGTMVMAVAFTVLGAGLVSFMKKNPIIIMLFLIPAFIGSVIVILSDHPLWPRFFFFTIGFGAIIVIRGAVELGQMILKPFHVGNKTSVLVTTIFCVLMVSASAASIPLAYAPKQDFQGALSFINKTVEPEDAVVTVGLTTFPYKKFFRMPWKAVGTVEELNEIRKHARHTWLLYTIPLHMKFEYPELMKSIERDFKVVKEFYGTLKGGTIFVCRADALSSQTSNIKLIKKMPSNND